MQRLCRPNRARLPRCRHILHQILHQSHEKGAAAFSRGCTADAPVGTACFHLGVLHASESLPSSSSAAATQYFVKGCKAGYGPSCHIASIATLVGLGLPSPDRAKALGTLPGGSLLSTDVTRSTTAP